MQDVGFLLESLCLIEYGLARSVMEPGAQVGTGGRFQGFRGQCGVGQST